MSYAKGRSKAGSDLLRGRIPKVEVAIPSICFMEALSTFESMRKSHKRFMAEFRTRFVDCERAVVWVDRDERLKHLKRGAVEVGRTFERFTARLGVAIQSLASHARFIEISPTILNRSLTWRPIDDSTDNLILTTLLDDVVSRPEARERAFLSENPKDFRDNLGARQALEDAGIRYFSRPEALIGWLGSLPAEPSA